MLPNQLCLTSRTLLGRRHPKQRYHKYHHDLDHHPLLAPLVGPALSRSKYGDALSALHGVYAPAEAWVMTFLGQHPRLFDYQRKLPALEFDLAALGRTPLPPSASSSAQPSIGALIGILYTLEGSTQGGRYIARQLTESGLPLSFFSGYGELSAQRWQDFLMFADALCPKEEYEMASQTAVSLFVAIKRHLDCAYDRFCGGLAQSCTSN